MASELYRFQDKTDEAVKIKLNGQTLDLRLVNGFLPVQRLWQSGDVLELYLPMPIRRVVASDSVMEDIGKVALQRGPLVYCAEGVDQANGQVLNLLLPDESELAAEFDQNRLQGVTVFHGKAYGTQFKDDGVSIIRNEQDFVAIPYYAWAHRLPAQAGGRGEMTVWLARDLAAAKPLLGPSIAAASAASSSGGEGLSALNDNRYPARSRDKTHGAFRWSPGRDSVWVQYDFQQPQEVSEVQVFWFDNAGRGNCRVPRSWRLLASFHGEWRPVWNDGQPWGTARDSFNQVIFETVKTPAVRMEVVLQPDATAGILEWRVF
jgi:hypothetical protein